MNFFVTLIVLAAVGVNMAFPRTRSKQRLEMCVSGDGSSYRGRVSQSVYGRKCLRWTRMSNSWGASTGVGNHNYCRNPDQSRMPWCFVRRRKTIEKEFCNIPRCIEPTVKPLAVDTEQTCGERQEQRKYKVVGGSFIPIESHPWIAAIFSQNSFLCGGSLIAPCWVLTAAHCFPDGVNSRIQRLSIYLGKTAINETDTDREQKFKVEKLILHKEFNVSTVDNDIALLKIQSTDGRCAAKSPSTRTVCLPPFHTELPEEFPCSIAGFGLERSDAWTYSQHLKQANVSLISQMDCQRKLFYGDSITNNMICAGSPDWSIDACKGDSGGPLVCDISGRMFLFGVVSWGDGCAKKNKPGVYAKVTNYNKWIAAETGLSKYTEGIMYPMK